MLTKLTLENFKSFQKAEIPLGPFTVLVGTNASGKSNIREALRFLHGIARDFTLAEIFGEKWIEGVPVWKGIRGGTREAAFHQEKTFAISLEAKTEKILIKDSSIPESNLCYRIKINVGENGYPPRVIDERLCFNSNPNDFLFDTHPPKNAPKQNNPILISVRLKKAKKGSSLKKFKNDKLVLSQIIELFVEMLRRSEYSFIGDFSLVWLYSSLLIQKIKSMRFFDFSPDAMRRRSIPGQPLGDQGENLSSVLYAICSDPKRKETLLQWVHELTPMDVKDFDFPADETGRILVSLIEENCQKISAYSASDGTLRFLAMLAALLSPEPARFYFFEELENGIHPTRLHLLLQLIEQKVSEGNIQVVATTHSPQLLGLLSPQSQEYASLTYRLSGQPDARIKRILDIPEAQELLQKQNLTRLHSIGWLEHAVEFLEDEEEGE